MKTVSVGFTLTHVRNDSSPMERHPLVDCYLDARFEREATRVHLKPQPQQVVAEGSISRSITTLPLGASIGFASFAWRLNEFKNPCLLDTGVTHIALAEIAEGLARSKDGKWSRDLNLTMHTAQDLIKGSIRVTFDREHFALPNMDFVPRTAHVASAIEYVGRGMVDYINSNMALEQSMQDTFKGTERMRIPYDYSESGIQSAIGTPLPAVAYVMSETPRSNTAYWENALGTVLARDGARWSSLNGEGKARTTILTISYLAQYLDYVGDRVDRNNRNARLGARLAPEQPYENFGDAITTWSGDCEDLASCILQCYNAFVGHNFPAAPEYNRFREMQAIAKQYVPPLSLDVVRGAQVNKVEHLGAHMNDNFIPVHKFKAWMEETREGRQLSRTLQWPERMDTSLPFMIGEGTGMYEPLGYENPVAAIAAYVYRAPSLESFKKPISHSKSQVGAFFIGSLVGLTDYFYKRGASAPLTFWYCTKSPSGELTRGASYDDMINNPKRIALKAQPAPSRPIMAAIEEAVALRVPPQHLYLEKSEAHKTNPHLEQICTTIAGLQRTPGPLAQRVPIYVRPHQLSKSAAMRIASDFTRLDRIWKVDYCLERITDQIWGYCMQVYVH